jgi:hypothetical protein
MARLMAGGERRPHEASRSRPQAFLDQCFEIHLSLAPAERSVRVLRTALCLLPLEAEADESQYGVADRGNPGMARVHTARNYRSYPYGILDAQSLQEPPDSVPQLENQPLGELSANALDLLQDSDVPCRDRPCDFLGCQCTQAGQGDRGPYSGNGENESEEIPFPRSREAEQSLLILPDVEVRQDGRFLEPFEPAVGRQRNLKVETDPSSLHHDPCGSELKNLSPDVMVHR